MGEWTPGDIKEIGIAISIVIAAMFSDRVINAYVIWSKNREERREKRRLEQATDRELDESGYRIVIRRLDKQITHLTAECDDLNDQLAKCREQAAKLAGQYEIMCQRYESATNRLKAIEGRQEQEQVPKKEAGG